MDCQPVTIRSALAGQATWRDPAARLPLPASLPLLHRTLWVSLNCCKVGIPEHSYQPHVLWIAKVQVPRTRGYLHAKLGARGTQRRRLRAQEPHEPTGWAPLPSAHYPRAYYKSLGVNRLATNTLFHSQYVTIGLQRRGV